MFAIEEKEFSEDDSSLSSDMKSEPKMRVVTESSAGGNDEVIIGGKNFDSSCGQFTYRVGVIDFITEHGFFKSVETSVKSALYNVDKNQISA